MKKFTKQLLALVAASAFALPASALPYGGAGPGAPLQGVLDGITVGGSSSVDVTTDDLADGIDSFWTIGGSGGAVNTLVIELAGFAGENTFGIYDTNNGTRFELFDGAASAGNVGAQLTLSILGDGTVIVSPLVGAGAILGNISSADFGFYLDSTPNNGGGLFFSDSSLNADGVDHLAVYEGTGDTIEIPPFASGPWVSNEYILAWEDLDCRTGCDGDYTDFVVLIESISAVPEPAILSLLALGLIGVGAARRRQV